MLGSHLSVAGGMVNALHEAARLGLECVQVFTKNQRQWTAKELSEADRDDWLQELKRLQWDRLEDSRVVSHNSYLINLASPAADLWERSTTGQRIELERCEALRIPFCVSHPGAHLDPEGRSPRAVPPSGIITAAEKAGLLRIVKALDRLHRELRGYKTITLLETTAGSGTSLGFDFAHLAFIRENVRAPERVGFCVDTCHIVAAGYDLSSDSKAKAVWDQLDACCGLAHVRAIHVNDSVGVLGSRVDRHAHIGDGACGLACFRSLMNRPEFNRVPKILETPKGLDGRGRNLDLVNIAALRRLITKHAPGS